MKVKVLKDFVTKKGKLIHKGAELDLNGEDGKFYQALLNNEFIEEIPACDVIDFEKGAIRSRLTGLLIASGDYVEGDKKHFTFDEALEIEKKLKDGWRLPTRSEWVLICEEFGQKDGKLDADTLVKNLHLGRNGGIFDSTLQYAGSSGYYWSSTAYSSANAFYLYFGTNVAPSSNYCRYWGFSFRCVKEVDNDKS